MADKQTVSNLADVMKECFPSDRLEKQFYDEQRFLNRIKKTSKFTHGKKAVVPLHKGRSGGSSVRSSAGGTLNGADKQKVDRAEWTVPYNYQEVEIEVAAINEAAGGGFSVGTAVNLEVDGALSDIRNQALRQFLGDGSGFIAACDTGGAATTVELLATGYGYDAIVRGQLYPGLPVDIGSTANPTSIVAKSVITAVKEDATDPDITIGSSVSTTSGTDFVSLAGSRSGSTSFESDGLRNMFASNTSASGGLDPDNAGEEFWKPAHVDSTTTSLSLNLLLTLQRKVNQKVGKPNGYVLMGLYQQANLYELLQNQARFTTDQLAAGNVEGVKWNQMELDALPEVPDREVYFLTLDDLAIVQGAKITQPSWMSSFQGANTAMLWKQGSTSFVDALVYPIGLAMKRRNGGASAIALTD